MIYWRSSISTCTSSSSGGMAITQWNVLITHLSGILMTVYHSTSNPTNILFISVFQCAKQFWCTSQWVHWTSNHMAESVRALNYPIATKRTPCPGTTIWDDLRFCIVSGSSGSCGCQNNGVGATWWFAWGLVGFGNRAILDMKRPTTDDHASLSILYFMVAHI